MSRMPRLAANHRHQHFRLRKVAVTALFALASSPSSAFVSSSAHSIATTSASPGSWGILRGGSFGGGRVVKTTRTMSTTTDATDTADTVTMTPASKLEALRAKMKELDLDVYLIPSDDPHLSGKYKHQLPPKLHDLDPSLSFS